MKKVLTSANVNDKVVLARDDNVPRHLQDKRFLASLNRRDEGVFLALVRNSLFHVWLRSRVAQFQALPNRGKQRLLSVAHFCIFLESFASLEIKETTKD